MQQTSKGTDQRQNMDGLKKSLNNTTGNALIQPNPPIRPQNQKGKMRTNKLIKVHEKHAQQIERTTLPLKFGHAAKKATTSNLTYFSLQCKIVANLVS